MGRVAPTALSARVQLRSLHILGVIRAGPSPPGWWDFWEQEGTSLGPLETLESPSTTSFRGRGGLPSAGSCCPPRSLHADPSIAALGDHAKLGGPRDPSGSACDLCKPPRSGLWIRGSVLPESFCTLSPGPPARDTRPHPSSGPRRPGVPWWPACSPSALHTPGLDFSISGPSAGTSLGLWIPGRRKALLPAGPAAHSVVWVWPRLTVVQAARCTTSAGSEDRHTLSLAWKHTASQNAGTVCAPTTTSRLPAFRQRLSHRLSDRGCSVGLSWFPSPLCLDRDHRRR